MAESALREALDADPGYPLPHFSLAVLFTVRGDALAAEAHAETAVKLGYTRNVTDRIAQTSTGLLARIEARGSGPEVSRTGV